ncbi:tetratricopeptide repeat protein [Vibrio sp. S4M6]|uniref:tetratricopeptide repeat protein n=1 Tax=Vibrio sinus TaxID=2946865 RepID=UPI00202A505A|nr:tetratricopeptide repeat protein [Vibrio sinus]MCL9782789.1 tetratricopeptide repeat protein [Vibrio sinus]
MLRIRWVILCCLFALPVSGSVLAATTSASPILEEAYKLLGFLPKQSKKLAHNYLTQRTLANISNRTFSPITHNKADTSIRTPVGTIDALQIIAQAEFNMRNYNVAFQQLVKAENLAKQYDLPYSGLLIKIQDTHLYWLRNHNSKVAQDSIQNIQKTFSGLNPKDPLANKIQYQLLKLSAEIASYDSNVELAKSLYSKLKMLANESKSEDMIIDYHISSGRFLLSHRLYNEALSDLLSGYWIAIENNASVQLATINQLLGELFYQRGVLDKAVDHLSQAADFYDNYEDTPLLPALLKQLGDIYFSEGRYNLALVHYFNVIDHENMQDSVEQITSVRLSLAATYLKLHDKSLAKRYLAHAESLIKYANFPYLNSRAALLKAALALEDNHSSTVVKQAKLALSNAKFAEPGQRIKLEERAYYLLYRGYEQAKQYESALNNFKKYNQLEELRFKNLSSVSENDFRQQKQFIEQTLHLVSQKKVLENTYDEYQKFKKIALVLAVIAIILSVFIFWRGDIVRQQRLKINRLKDDLFAHSRSGLRNLRMLNAKLPESMEQSSMTFEKWHIGELIHEPLSDRLRFVMIDIPFLRSMYLQHGYSEGLKLERKFGEFLRGKIEAPARIYHFSDANLLYIEKNADKPATPEEIFNKVQGWIDEFEPQIALNRIIRVGMADYPFLPRAYTAINDQELLDILLMSTSAARTLSMKEHASQWIYLKAIDNAPAASLATGDIRKACKHSIGQGLIKVHSSFENEESIKKLLKDS